MPRLGVPWWTKLRCALFGHPGVDFAVAESADGGRTYHSICERCGARLTGGSR